MEITLITIILSSVSLLLAVVTPMISPFFRIPKTSDISTDNIGENKNAGTHPVSIVIVSHDNAPELERHLPHFLSQDYNAGYEVIIVADKSDTETEDVVKRFSSHDNLYATFMPLSSRYISRKKLAVTLGMKAARYPWVIVTDAWCCPETDNWLTAFASHMDKSADIVLGYTNYDNEAPASYVFSHAVDASYNLRFAQKGVPYGIGSPLLAIRKKIFMDADGYLGNLKYVRGEYDFLVNKFADSGNARTAFSADAFLKEVTPYKKRWLNNHLFYINARKNMQGNFNYRLHTIMDTSAFILYFASILSAVIYGAITMQFVTIAAGCLAIVTGYIIRMLIARKTIKAFNCNISPALVPLLQALQPVNSLMMHIRYLFADKYDFITHKL